MKIRYPIGEYYDDLSINEYKEKVFEEDDDYVIITPDDTCDNDNLILTHKPYMEKVNQNVVLIIPEYHPYIIHPCIVDLNHESHQFQFHTLKLYHFLYILPI